MDKIAVRYVGAKEVEDDHLYGTGEWRPGDVRDIEVNTAALLFSHPDVWADARSTKARKERPVPPRQQEPAYIRRPLDEPPPTANFGSMNESGLRHYAQTYFNETLPENMPLPDMRLRVQEIIRLRG